MSLWQVFTDRGSYVFASDASVIQTCVAEVSSYSDLNTLPTELSGLFQLQVVPGQVAFFCLFLTLLQDVSFWHKCSSALDYYSKLCSN